jgi:RNA polymerase sigma-70 factor (ECF subfamily)
MFEAEERVETFNKHRPRLFGIAYRMLGTRDDAEDIVQEAYIRWHKADVDEIESPEAWLVTVATRLSIDRLRKASAERETYIGPWLPEPILTSQAPSPQDDFELASNLSLAFMTLLERLSPVERAVFLLHDIFDCAYPEIARITQKSETAVRQMIHRARNRVRSDAPRFEPDETERVRLIRKFTAASYAGDQETLLSLFADDVALTSDGGGVVSAARRTIYGAKRLTNLYMTAVAKHSDQLMARLVNINGETGVLEYADGQPFSVSTFTIKGGRISAIYRVMNPEKLKAFADLRENNFEDPLSQTEVVDRLG